MLDLGASLITQNRSREDAMVSQTLLFQIGHMCQYRSYCIYVTDRNLHKDIFFRDEIYIHILQKWIQIKIGYRVIMSEQTITLSKWMCTKAKQHQLPRCTKTKQQQLSRAECVTWPMGFTQYLGGGKLYRIIM